ncbi:hypothetical protein [Microcoleus sp. T2B6]
MASIDGNGSTKATATTLYFPRIPILDPSLYPFGQAGDLPRSS